MRLANRVNRSKRSSEGVSRTLVERSALRRAGSDSGVILKARGRAISTAVDTAEIVRNRFVKDAKLKDIKISTESVTNEEGRDSNVSSIEITLSIK